MTGKLCLVIESTEASGRIYLIRVRCVVNRVWSNRPKPTGFSRDRLVRGRINYGRIDSCRGRNLI